MHICNNCGKTFEKYSKLERHNSARNPCRPPTHHCDNCNKGFASYQSLWKHKQKWQGPSNYINYPVGQKRPTDISTVSLEIPPTFVAATAKESSLEPGPKNPKIQALLDEIVNDDPKRHVPPQAIHQGFCIVPPQHHLRRKKYRHHLLHHHHHHIHLRKCCYRHRNRCHRSHPQKL